MGYVAITLDGRALRVTAMSSGDALLTAVPAAPRDAGEPGGPAEPADAVFERIDLSHGRIALRVHDGRYLARHRTHPESTEVDDAGFHLVGEIIPCAAFEEVLLPGGFLSLRGCDMRFLGVHTSGAVVADRVANGTWERFRYRELPAPTTPVPVQGGSAVVQPTFAAV